MTETEPTIYTTMGELVEREIVAALGDYGDDYDIEGIALSLRKAELIEYREVPGAAHRNGFAMTATPAEFWAHVQRFDMTA